MANKGRLLERAGVRKAAVAESALDEIVDLLRKAWTVPQQPGFVGCDACRSGLDRLVIEDPAFRNFGR